MRRQAGRPRALATVVLGSTLFAASTSPAATEQSLRITQLNRTYTDFVRSIEPVGDDLFGVRWSSPSQTVELLQHEIRATPTPAGLLAGEIELTVRGEGDLVALVSVAGGRQEFEDRLTVPEQTVRVPGAVRVQETVSGFRVEIVEAPRQIQVEIRSRLAERLDATCRGAALLSLGALDCSPLVRSLEQPTLPLGLVGQVLELPRGELTGDELAALRALVAAAETLTDD